MLKLIGAAAALFLVSIMMGSTFIPPLEVAASLLGFGSPAVDFVVREFRLPRALTALLVGLALGASGTLFQRVLGNPLAAPDLLGVSSGATAATVGAIVLLEGSGFLLSLTAVLGALASAVVIYLLAWRQKVAGYRFILVGVGVGALMGSLTSYLLSRADVADARASMTWLVGSVGVAGDIDNLMLGLAVAAFVPLSFLLDRMLGVLELGDDTALGLGAGVQRLRLFVMAVATVLVALATAAAGPIGFIALMAGPISARLGPRRPRVLAAACVGAVLVLAADFLAQHALPTPVSTGVVTGLVGAPYIAYILIKTSRKGVGR